MTEQPRGTVVVGASTAGLATAEALRALGDTAPVTLVGEEPRLPYNRPSLTKQVLTGAWAPEQATLLGAAALDALGIRVVTGVRATRLDLERREVATASVEDGRPGRIPFETLVVATGVSARRHPAVPTALTVRTLDDVLALRAAWSAGPRVVVIGGGVLGCELASAARGAGLDVEIVTRDPGLQPGGLGRHVDERVERLFDRHGVRLRRHVDVVASRVSGEVTRLDLSDGTHVEADLVVAAIGAEPAVGWLRGSGLQLADGVLCAPDGQAAAGVYAVGDVSARWDPRKGRYVRAENQTRAIEQAQDLAAALVTGAGAPPRQPYFWTELFGTRIQALGHVPPVAQLRVVAGEVDGDRFVAAYGPPGAACAVVGWNMAREFRLARALVTEQGRPSTTTTGGSLS